MHMPKTTVLNSVGVHIPMDPYLYVSYRVYLFDQLVILGTSEARIQPGNFLCPQRSGVGLNRSYLGRLYPHRYPSET